MRAVEVLHAVDEVVRLIGSYDEPDVPAVAVEPRAGTGHGCCEAPRGTLYHRYWLADDGTILEAKIVPRGAAVPLAGERATVVGVGNEWRRDDAVGLVVAGRLRALKLPGVRVLERTATRPRSWTPGATPRT